MVHGSFLCRHGSTIGIHSAIWMLLEKHQILGRLVVFHGLFVAQIVCPFHLDKYPSEKGQQAPRHLVDHPHGDV